MPSAEHFKRILAVVILICFFLPLAQCSAKPPADARNSQVNGAPQDLIPARDIKFDSLDEIPMVTAFLWPLAFIAIRIRTGSVRSVAAVGLVEVVLGGTVLWYVVQTIRLWGTVRYGGVVLIAAHVLYLVVALITVYGCARASFDRAGRSVRQRST